MASQRNQLKDCANLEPFSNQDCGMVAQPQGLTSDPVIYPESDGKPMADNTRQFRWIVTIKENLEILYADQPDVFVAGDLLWYPIEHDNGTSQAPDAMVAFGRPKGDRGSYRQWLEDNIAPQVVFEILSPSNTRNEMAKKVNFYELHGVEEYYEYDPDRHQLRGRQRLANRLISISDMHKWISPLLGIRFEMTEDVLNIYSPSGDRFLTPVELSQARDQACQQAKDERQRAEDERQRAENEKQRAENEKQRADRLAERLRALGIDPDISL